MARPTPSSLSNLFRRHRAAWPLLGLILLLLPSLLHLPAIMHNEKAQMYFDLPDQNFSPDQTFPVELRVRSDAQAINAVSSVVTFNPNLLEVVSMTTSDSFCSFYTDNSFDNIKGEITIGCGTPNPGFTGDSTIFSVQMRTKNIGMASLDIKQGEAAVLANDGKGTNLLYSVPHATISIKQLL